MQSFLIVGSTIQERKEKAETFLTGTSTFDVTILEGNTVGINEMRHLIHSLSFKPIQSENKVTIIFEAQTLTIEAQHALLKTLEEPPGDTVIILTAPNPELLLPTIVSRCQVIELTTNKQRLTANESEVRSQQLAVLLSEGVGEQLKLAQDVSKTKEEALSWLERMTIFVREKLIDIVSNNNTNNSNNETIATLLHCLIAFQKTHTILNTTNVNVRLALENLFLNTPF